MNKIDTRLLDILRSRSTWRKGKVRLSMEEVRNLIASRFPQDPCPTAHEIRTSLRHLVVTRMIRWGVATDDGIAFIG